MLQLNQLAIDGALANLRTVDRDSLKNALNILNNLLDKQFKISISGTVVTISSSEVQTLQSDGSYSTTNAEKIGITPISNLYSVIAQSTIDLSDGSVTGDFVASPAGLAMTTSNYVAIGFELRKDKKWHVVFGTENAVKDDTLLDANTPGFSSSAVVKRAVLLLQKAGAGDWNFVAPSLTDLILLPLGGGGGGGTGDATLIQARLDDQLQNSIYEFYAASIFKQDEDVYVDTPSTGSFSSGDEAFLFTTGSQTLVTTNNMTAEYVEEGRTLADITVDLFWRDGIADANAVVEVSENNGGEWQNVTMVQLGSSDTYVGDHTFTEPAAFQNLEEYADTNEDSDEEFDASTQQEISQEWTPTKDEIIQQATVYLSKLGSPLGSFTVYIIEDDGSGSPSTNTGNIIGSSAAQSIASLSAGDNAVVVDMGDVVVRSGVKYHLVIKPDASYRTSFSTGVDALRWRADSTPTIPVARKYNGTAWSADTFGGTYKLEGKEYALLLRVTSSQAATLDAYAIHYGSTGEAQNDTIEQERFTFHGVDDNTNVFAVGNFVVNHNFLEVCEVGTGQVYVYPAFSVAGNTVTFPANTFNKDEDIELLFKQPSGSVDTSDMNANVLAENHLGSTDPTFDKSVADRGILLRSADGTLYEAVIQNGGTGWDFYEVTP